jgi:hypothetical protein
MTFGTASLLFIATGISFAGNGSAPAVAKARPALKISLDFLDFGFSAGGMKGGFWPKTDDPRLPKQEQEIPVMIQNQSNHPVDLYTDGTSWGDPCITFYVTTPDGHTVKIENDSGSYFVGNEPDVVRLQPGQTWCREVLYHTNAWSSLKEVIRSVTSQATFVSGKTTVKIRVELHQKGDPFYTNNPNIWIGKVGSPEVVAAVYGGAGQWKNR